jgi:hypothetical protein
MTVRISGALVGAIALALSSTLSATAVAAAADYKFELASAKPAGDGKTDVAVRLVRTLDSKPVGDAVVFESKADMGPSGMATMPGKVTAVPPGKDGLYHFTTATGMAGKWALHLSAKVQGETETVKGTVEFAAQ